jgi:hypothetical protein
MIKLCSILACLDHAPDYYWLQFHVHPRRRHLHALFTCVYWSQDCAVDCGGVTNGRTLTCQQHRATQQLTCTKDHRTHMRSLVTRDLYQTYTSEGLICASSSKSRQPQPEPCGLARFRPETKRRHKCSSPNRPTFQSAEQLSLALDAPSTAGCCPASRYSRRPLVMAPLTCEYRLHPDLDRVADPRQL